MPRENQASGESSKSRIPLEVGRAGEARREPRSRCSQWEAGSRGEGLGPGPPYLGRQGEEQRQQGQRHQQQHQQAPRAPHLLGQRRQRRHPRDRRETGRPDCPSAAGKGPKAPRGGGGATRNRPGRASWAAESPGQGAGKGPRSPSPPLHPGRACTMLGTLDSTWETGQRPGEAEGLSPVTPVQTLWDRPRCRDPQMDSSDRGLQPLPELQGGGCLDEIVLRHRWVGVFPLQ